MEMILSCRFRVLGGFLDARWVVVSTFVASKRVLSKREDGVHYLPRLFMIVWSKVYDFELWRLGEPENSAGCQGKNVCQSHGAQISRQLHRGTSYMTRRE